jgi:hypothetical protein
MYARNQRFINDAVYREEVLYNLTSKLRVNVSSLSSTRRRLQSADDFRKLAKDIGLAGVLVVAAVASIIVLPDAYRLAKGILYMMR